MKEAIIVVLVVLPVLILGLLLANWLEPDNENTNGAASHQPAIILAAGELHA